MGSGIAQVAAQHGAQVTLFDVSADAIAAANERILKSLDGLAAKARLDPEHVAETKQRITLTSDLAELADCELVIEAIIEDAEAKSDLFAKLEALLTPKAVIASNTSSLPIAHLARSLEKPARFVGMHFFNPPTVMKLVEVVAGPATDCSVCSAINRTAETWGKVAVGVADVPGFIVNRVARPFYAEAFQALQEDAAQPAEIDALFKGVGFRMGPLELTDFIGQDVNFTVARSIYDSYYGHARFRPQLRQAALVDAGWLGRKAGRGIYDYSQDKEPAEERSSLPPQAVSVEDQTAARSLIGVPWGERVVCQGVEVGLTSGSTAQGLAASSGKHVALFDWFDSSDSGPIAFAASSDSAAAVAERLVAALKRPAIRIGDRPGLIVARTLAQIANAASDAVFDRVADEDGIDSALRFGANYPFGPFGWAERCGRANVRRMLDAIAAETGDPIYAPSQYMRNWL